MENRVETAKREENPGKGAHHPGVAARHGIARCFTSPTKQLLAIAQPAGQSFGSRLRLFAASSIKHLSDGACCT
jgi:hypothetical protein